MYSFAQPTELAGDGATIGIGERAGRSGRRASSRILLFQRDMSVG